VIEPRPGGLTIQLQAHPAWASAAETLLAVHTRTTEELVLSILPKMPEIFVYFYSCSLNLQINYPQIETYMPSAPCWNGDFVGTKGFFIAIEDRYFNLCISISSIKNATNFGF
jgi:hypothetical protein